MNFRGQKLQRMIDSSELCSCVSEKYNPECLEMIMGGQTREAMCVWAYHVDEAPDGGVAGVPEVARRLGDLDGEDGEELGDASIGCRLANQTNNNNNKKLGDGGNGG